MTVAEANHFDISIPEKLVGEPQKKTYNPLIDHQSYVRLGKSNIFEARPAVLHFGSIEESKTMEITLYIQNISSKSQRLHIIPPSTAFFNVSFEKKGLIAPGMAEVLKVRFRASDGLRYYYDHIRVHSSDENLLIPCHAYPKMNSVTFPRSIHMGECYLGQTTMKVVELKCSLPISFEFELTVLKQSPDFAVSPLKGIIPADGSVEICIEFHPTTMSTATTEIQLSISEFDFKPVTCVVTASAGPGAIRNAILRDAEASLMSQADLRTSGVRESNSFRETPLQHFPSGAASSPGPGVVVTTPPHAEDSVPSKIVRLGSMGATPEGKGFRFRENPAIFENAVIGASLDAELGVTLDRPEGGSGVAPQILDHACTEIVYSDIPPTIENYVSSGNVAIHTSGGAAGAYKDPYSVAQAAYKTIHARQSFQSGTIEVRYPEVRPPTPETEVEGIRFPSKLDSVSAVNYVLTQEPGKLKIRDLKAVIEANQSEKAKQSEKVAEQDAMDKTMDGVNDLHGLLYACGASGLGLDDDDDDLTSEFGGRRGGAPTHGTKSTHTRTTRTNKTGVTGTQWGVGRDGETRQVKEIRFERAIARRAENERSKEIQWFMCIGEDMTPAETIEAVCQARDEVKKQDEAEQQLRAMRRTTTSITKGCPSHPAGIIHEHQPTWNPYLNDDWGMRKRVIRRFGWGARAVMLRGRISKRLERLGIVLDLVGRSKEGVQELLKADVAGGLVNFLRSKVTSAKKLNSEQQHLLQSKKKRKSKELAEEASKDDCSEQVRVNVEAAEKLIADLESGGHKASGHPPTTLPLVGPAASALSVGTTMAESPVETLSSPSPTKPVAPSPTPTPSIPNMEDELPSLPSTCAAAKTGVPTLDMVRPAELVSYDDEAFLSRRPVTLRPVPTFRDVHPFPLKVPLEYELLDYHEEEYVSCLSFPPLADCSSLLAGAAEESAFREPRGNPKAEKISAPSTTTDPKSHSRPASRLSTFSRASATEQDLRDAAASREDALSMPEALKKRAAVSSLGMMKPSELIPVYPTVHTSTEGDTCFPLRHHTRHPYRLEVSTPPSLTSVRATAAIPSLLEVWAPPGDPCLLHDLDVPPLMSGPQPGDIDVDSDDGDADEVVDVTPDAPDMNAIRNEYLIPDPLAQGRAGTAKSMSGEEEKKSARNKEKKKGGKKGDEKRKPSTPGLNTPAEVTVTEDTAIAARIPQESSQRSVEQWLYTKRRENVAALHASMQEVQDLIRNPALRLKPLIPMDDAMS